MNKINFDPVILTQALVKCSSITPKDEGALNIVEEHLNNINFKCTRLPFSDKNTYDVNNLFATIGLTGKHLAFAGHTDVVPPGNESSWKYPPFSATIENDKMFGRGTEDMKSNIACFISATNKFIEKHGSDFGGKLSFIITGDEEGLAINGTPKIMEWTKKNNISFDHCIVGEPTSDKFIGDKIKIGRRGSLSCNLEVQGSQGHVAYPHLSKNPINSLIAICKKLKEKRLDKGNKHFQPSNLEFTGIHVDNTVHNVIPSRAKMQFNIRYNNFHTATSLKKMINSAVNSICKKNKVKFKIEFLTSGDAFLTKPDTTIQMVKKIIKKITKVNTIFSTTGGTSDARFIKKIAPCLEFGLVNKTMHKIDECVSLTDLKKLTKIYQNILIEYFK